LRRPILFAAMAAAVFATVTPSQAEEPRRGGSLTLGVYTGEPNNFDCHGAVSTSVMHRVTPSYSTLIKIDAKTYPNIVADLADSWTASPDGLTYTFKLHPDVHFHDGSVLTSADIKATFDRIRNPPEKVISARKQLYEDIAAIDTPDDLTVVFRLSKPNAAMLTFLASPWNCVYSAKLLASDPDYPTRKVMGTGPFRFASYVPGSEYVAKRFDNYFKKGQPYLDELRISGATGAGLINATMSGQIAADLGGVTPAEKDRLVSTFGDKVRVYEVENPAFLGIAINTTRKPFDDVRVRQALNLAIDRWGGSPSMAKLGIYSGVGGYSRPGSTYARSSDELAKLPGFRRDMAANRAEARRLLAEAGQSDLKFVFTNRPAYSYLGVFLIDQWRQIGVTVTQDFPDNSRVFSVRSNAAFDVMMDTNNQFVDEPSLHFAPYQSYDKNDQNIARSNDPKMDDLFERQQRVLNVGERRKIVQELEAYALDRAYTIPLLWGHRTVVVPTYIEGFAMAPSAAINMDHAELWLRE
jgi:peptide/nickel transport system substrate-binding protein